MPSDLDGEVGFVVAGTHADAASGIAHGIGDFNGDGFDDLVIGAYEADPNGIEGAGEAYVVYGSDQPFPARLNLSEINGTNGFVFMSEEEGASLGEDTSGAGDLNGDGLDDLVVGARFANSGGFLSTGAAYVVLGEEGATFASLSTENLDGTNGFAFLGSDSGTVGDSVAAAGDVNGDGLDDLMIGNESGDDNGTNSGATYAVFGRSLLEVDIAGSECPGRATVSISGATAKGEVAVVVARSLGSTPLPRGRCDLLQSSLDQARLARLITADANGEAVLTGGIPATACGGLLQAIDLEACRKSAVLELPMPGASGER